MIENGKGARMTVQAIGQRARSGSGWTATAKSISCQSRSV
jgi:hypothetical protein